MPGPFVFFDLGQTLIDEWEFIDLFDNRFIEILNGFGARIDRRNYLSVRDSVIRDRRIGTGFVKELVVEVSKLLAPQGYHEAIASRLKQEIRKARITSFRFSNDAPAMLERLREMKIEMGLIANQSEDIDEILEKSGLDGFFSVKAISSSVKFSKPNPRIFQFALDKAARSAKQCIMVGDRLDTDICPANTVGMKTIRYTNSLFSLQTPSRECEQPTFTVASLLEIPGILERIIL